MERQCATRSRSSRRSRVRPRATRFRPTPIWGSSRIPSSWVSCSKAASSRSQSSRRMAAAPLLEARALSASYGRVAALKPTSLTVAEGELVTVLGPNGAGKTTLLRAITRLIQAEGQVLFKGEDVSRLATHQLAARGIIMVQEGRGLFPGMSVRENLVLGAYTLGNAGAESERRLAEVFSLFPRLKERIDQVAGSLSGGEQQMLAVGRALMAGPKLLMLDEPSLGLAPKVAAGILETLGE